MPQSIPCSNKVTPVPKASALLYNRPAAEAFEAGIHAAVLRDEFLLMARLDSTGASRPLGDQHRNYPTTVDQT